MSGSTITLQCLPLCHLDVRVYVVRRVTEIQIQVQLKPLSLTSGLKLLTKPQIPLALAAVGKGIEMGLCT